MNGKRKIIAVTGATGHLGGNLVRALLEQGERVRVLVHRDRRALEGLDLELIPGDILDPDSLRRAFADAATVYHSAARISITGDRDGMVYRTNVEGTRNVVNACLSGGVERLVHFSSIHAISGRLKDGVVDETGRLVLDDPDVPAYDRSKALGELEVRRGIKEGLDAIIIAPTGVIGPHDYKPSRMGQVLLDICHHRMPALIDGGYNWVDARDVIKMALAAAESGRSGEKYLASGNWVHFRELARIIGEVAGHPVTRLITPMWLGRAAAPFAVGWSRVAGTRPLFTPEGLRALRRHRHVSCWKADLEFGYRPRPIDETIADTLSWFKEAGMLEG
ncbi:MAG: SDR family oxidoreductase [Candidatus Euphemobacter frigidus]|nr:SDR family oxidoreductase [Candidatus Euphemobacter frigidus]MDP8276036.1 SDR family oxidoreductase [Candidatus Euphemobacter frigidus]